LTHHFITRNWNIVTQARCWKQHSCNCQTALTSYPAINPIRHKFCTQQVADCLGLLPPSKNVIDYSNLLINDLNIMVAVCVTENDYYFASSFFSQPLFLRPFLHRFSRNVATRRRFVGNRKLSSLHLVTFPLKLGDKTPFWRFFSDTASRFCNIIP